MTLATRIGRKTLALEKDQAKIEEKIQRVKLLQAEVASLRKDVEQKQAEIDLIGMLKVEAEELMEKRGELQSYTDGLLAKFDAIPWRPDMDWSEKIESTDYQEKVDERHAINERLAEIEKTANKTYYRR